MDEEEDGEPPTSCFEELPHMYLHLSGAVLSHLQEYPKL